MIARRLGLALALLTLAGPSLAQNRQAFSTSMVECSHVLNEIVELGERKGADEAMLGEFRKLLVLFRLNAPEQARREGVSDVDTHIATLADQMERKWDGRLSRIWVVQENKDWFDYCMAFAGHLGLTE